MSRFIPRRDVRNSAAYKGSYLIYGYILTGTYVDDFALADLFTLHGSDIGIDNIRHIRKIASLSTVSCNRHCLTV